MVMWSPVQDSMAFDTAQAEHEAILAALEAENGDETEWLVAAHVRWHWHGDITQALETAHQKRALAV